MKAVVYENYGPPDVLQLKEVDKPIPKDDEVRIKIHATTVTAADGLMRRGGDSFIGKIVLGFPQPRKKYRIPGIELAGEIDAVGKKVTRFTVGDQVYGFRGFGTGACAQYKCMAEKGSLAPKPANLNYNEAASVVDGASTALFFLQGKANIQPGQHVLINGASGSIGTFAVQLAKYFGAEVTGVCSTSNLDMVTSLGADRVIDYTQEDFTNNGERYDIIFDTVGKSSWSKCKGALKQNGFYLVTTGSFLAAYGRTFWTARFGSKKHVFAMSVEKNEALVFLKQLIEAGTIKPIIDRVYPMAQIVDAHRYVDTGRKKGNVVITVDHA